MPLCISRRNWLLLLLQGLAHASSLDGKDAKLEFALPISTHGSLLQRGIGLPRSEASILGTTLLETDDGVNAGASVPERADVEQRVMAELLTEDAHTELLRRKEKELSEETSCLSWTEDECAKKTHLACSWNKELNKCLKACGALNQSECSDRMTCTWSESSRRCSINPHAQPEEGQATLHRHQGELDEESADGCIPFTRPDYWDATRHVADSMEETLFFRMNQIKKMSYFARCGITDWKFEADVEVASQLVACRMWRVFFSWVSVQMERELGFSPDWRDANSTFVYYSWLWKLAQPQSSFYDRIWMLSKDGFDASMRGPTNREKYLFGTERRSALYEEIVAELTTRPIYFHLVDIFNSVSGKGLDSVQPYYGSYGWFHLGRTRDAKKITDMVDTMIQSIGQDDPVHRDSDRQILGIENFRAALAEKQTLQRLCPKLYLDPQQYSHTSFTPWKQEHRTEPPVWNTREEPLACSLSQVLLRLRAWHEVNRPFSLVDSLPSKDSDAATAPGMDTHVFSQPIQSGWAWWVMLLLIVLIIAITASLVSLSLHWRNRR